MSDLADELGHDGGTRVNAVIVRCPGRWGRAERAVVGAASRGLRTGFVVVRIAARPPRRTYRAMRSAVLAARLRGAPVVVTARWRWRAERTGWCLDVHAPEVYRHLPAGPRADVVAALERVVQIVGDASGFAGQLAETARKMDRTLGRFRRVVPNTPPEAGCPKQATKYLRRGD